VTLNPFKKVNLLVLDEFLKLFFFRNKNGSSQLVPEWGSYGGNSLSSRVCWNLWWGCETGAFSVIFLNNLFPKF